MLMIARYTSFPRGGVPVKININRKAIFLWGVLFCLIFFYQMRFDFIEGSDDSWFFKVKDQFSIVDYLAVRYQTWSARIFPETMLYYIFHIPVNLWRLLNTGFILLLSTSIVRIFKLKVDVYDVILVILLFGYSSFDIIHSGFFWMTGSVNYLWPLALAAYVLIPFGDSYFRNTRPTFSLKQLLRVFATCILAVSNEQVLFCVIGIMIVHHIYIFKVGEKQSRYFFILLLLLIGGAAIMIVAPGNSLRFDAEIPRWFPEFNELSLLGHLRIGIFWLFEQVVTHLKFFMLLISLLTINLLQSNNLRKLFYFLGTLTASLAIVKPMWLTDFNRIKTISFTNLFSSGVWLSRDFLAGLFPYVFWSVILMCIILCSCLVSDKPMFIFCCYLAGLCSCVIMFFSPTIYASGPRVFNCLVVFLVLISFTLFQKCIQQKNESPAFSLFLLSIFPLFLFLLS